MSHDYGLTWFLATFGSVDFIQQGTLGTSVSEILSETHAFSFKNAFENVVIEMAAIWARFLSLAQLGVTSDYAQPITGQVTEVTCPVIGRAQPELSPSKRQKMGPGLCLKVLTRLLANCHLMIWLPPCSFAGSQSEAMSEKHRLPTEILTTKFACNTKQRSTWLIGIVLLNAIFIADLVI